MEDRNAKMSRRGALRMIGAATLGAAAASGLMGSASAGRAWCRADPLFKIGNYTFDVIVMSDLKMLTSASGPVKVTLTVPTGVSAQHLVSDLGFGYGYDVKIVKSSSLAASKSRIQVRVDVVAPARDSSLPVTVQMTSLSLKTVVSQSTASGTANKTVSWSGTIETVSALDSLISL